MLLNNCYYTVNLLLSNFDCVRGDHKFVDLSVSALTSAFCMVARFAFIFEKILQLANYIKRGNPKFKPTKFAELRAIYHH